MPAYTRRDRVFSKPTHDHLEAVTADYRVITAQLQHGRFHPHQHRTGYRQHVVGVVFHPAVVPQDHVRAITRGDLVTTHTAQHHVVPITQRDHVRSTRRGHHVRRLRYHQRTRVGQHIKVKLRVIARNNVPAYTRRDRVFSKPTNHQLVTITSVDGVVTAFIDQRALGSIQDAGQRPQDFTMVTNQDVGSGTGGNAVIP